MERATLQIRFPSGERKDRVDDGARREYCPEFRGKAADAKRRLIDRGTVENGSLNFQANEAVNRNVRRESASRWMMLHRTRRAVKRKCRDISGHADSARKRDETRHADPRGVLRALNVISAVRGTAY